MVDPADSEITSVSLSQGMCYGTCPVYEVILRRDGTASWHGKRSRSESATSKGRSMSTTSRAWRASSTVRGSFGWRDEYVAPVTDNPTYELEVVRDGDGKKVVQYATDDPPDFWVVAALVDWIASGIEWVERKG
jgi:hypothetical protein